MEKIKLLIIIFLIVVLIISIMIVLINKLGNNNMIESDFEQTEFEHKDTYEAETGIIQVNNRNKYYAVEKILNTYIRYIKEMKGIIDFQKYDDDEIKSEGVSHLYNILDPSYISEFNINKDDLQNKIKEYNDYNLKINKMYVYEKTTSINIYFVYATIADEELNLLIKTDSVNMTYSIFLNDYIEKKSYNVDMSTSNIDINDNIIEKNEDNQYKYTNITDQYMAVQYMNSLKDNLINNIEYTYDNLLEQEYRDKRFKNIDNFIEYIADNKDELENISIKKYMVNNYNDYKEYVCIDQYNNYYIFKEKAIMDYSFKLDTYTVTEDVFADEYVVASGEKKVQMNIDKFIQMINRHDYITSYDCISNSFKNNYFNTQDKFENYIKNNFFVYNKFEFKNIEKKGSNLYVCTLRLTDLLEKSSEIKEINIIMQLNDNLNFEMSFSIE